jgi:hypothetical protein
MDHFVILTRVEFISLINYLKIKVISSDGSTNRVVQINEKNIIDTLLKLPLSDFDEDYMIVKCSLNGDDLADTFSLNLGQIKEIIPFTHNSFLSYKRKFSDWLTWTEPNKYNLESFYNSFLVKKMKLDSINNFELSKKNIFKIVDENLFCQVVLEDLIQAKIDKQLKGKKDTEIEKNEYNHVFQSLMIYEQGSHFPRESAMGFLLHAMGVYMLHDGIGRKLGSKIKLSTIPTIVKLKEMNTLNYLGSFKNLFSNSEVKSVIETFLSKIGESNCFEDLKTISYFLFYKFLISEKEMSLRNVYLIVKELNGNMEITFEEQKAFLLVAMDCSTPKIAADIMLENQNVLIVDREINQSQSHIDFELISRYYKAKNKEVCLENSSSKKNTFEPSMNELDPVPEIIKNLPSELVKKDAKKKYFNNEILLNYREALEKASYDLSKKEIKELLFNRIFPNTKSKRR